MPMLCLEAVPTGNILCACIVGYFDSASSTTAHHDCHPHLYSATDPPSSDYFPVNFSGYGTC